MRNVLTRLSPAMVVAMLAIFVALTGTAVATTSALITGKQIANNSITGADVKNRSLTPRDFRGSVRGPRGLRGLQGLQGPQGAQGPQGPQGDTGPPGAPNPNAANSELLDGLDSSAFVQKAETFTRHFSCAGTAWENAFSTTAYSTSGSLKHGNGGSPLFRCSVNVPTGATVTAVSCAVRDLDASSVSCEMWRTNMTTGVGGETNMASVSSTGTPGAHRITDTTITQPVIDNANFSYFLQSFSGSDSNTGMYGAIVTYVVSGEQGIGAALNTPAANRGGASTASLHD